jgi:hypothetical protein
MRRCLKKRGAALFIVIQIDRFYRIFVYSFYAMNEGNPPKANENLLTVTFQSTAVTFEQQIIDWLSDNPNYDEMSKSTVLRTVIFKKRRKAQTVERRLFLIFGPETITGRFVQSYSQPCRPV